MKLWAKRGKWRLSEIREVSPGQLVIERAAIAHRGEPAIGVPYAYAVIDGQRHYAPLLARYVEVEEETVGSPSKGTDDE
jgi:hypothetical protein